MWQKSFFSINDSVEAVSCRYLLEERRVPSLLEYSRHYAAIGLPRIARGAFDLVSL